MATLALAMPRAITTSHLSRAIQLLSLVIVLIEVAFVVTNSPGSDAHAYWTASITHPYAHGLANTADAYLYSPAFLEALTPLRALPFLLFWAVWVVGSAAILVWLVGPEIAAVALVPTAYSPTFTELWYGNIVMPMALVLTVGMRHSGLWAFMLLTKVTPGIGLVWFAARREWRRLGIALGTTGAILILSLALAPTAWAEWIAALAANAAAPASIGAHLPDLTIRLPLAVLVIVVGALRNQIRVLPIAIILAIPVFWWASVSLLLVWIRQVRDAASARAPIAVSR